MTRETILRIARAAGDGPAVRASLAAAGADVSPEPEWYGPPVGAETLAVIRAEGRRIIVRRLGRALWTIDAPEPRP